MRGCQHLLDRIRHVLFGEAEKFEYLCGGSGFTIAIDAYDCANGCNSEQGTAGDYNLTVTVTTN